MALYQESGLSIDLPAGQHFRFADLPAYRKLSGQRLKEMDFAWIADGALFMLEVKDYGQMTAALSGAHFVPVIGQAVPFRFQGLVDKVTDSVLMMLAAWADTACGRELRNALPSSASGRVPIKLIIALDLPAHLSVHLQSLRDSLNEHLRGRIALADVSSVVLMDYTRLVSNPAFSAFIKRQG